jgi:peptide/nickel transport system substrate-binding protein
MYSVNGKPSERVKTKIALRMFGLAVAGAFLLAGCGSNPASAGSGTSPSGQADDKTTLTVAMPADEDTLDPAVTMDNAAWKITYPCYERLVKYKGAETTVEPDLATDWKVSDGGKVWTFTLKEGHKFPDGTPVDANAVKFTFDRLLKINKGPAGDFTELKEVKVLDPTHVQFVLKTPFPAFLSSLAANYASIVDPKVMDHEQNGDMGQAWLSEHTMGSGPYQLAEWKKGQYLLLTANDSYSGPKPALKKVYFKIIGDASAERLQLEKGAIDIAEGIPADQLKSLSSEPGITLINKPSMLVDYVYINCTKGNPALQNKLVRQAISYAIDYKGIMDSSQSGYATQMRGPIPEGMWGHDESIPQYTYDVNKAKQLLAQANVKDLTLTLLYSDHMPWWPSEALAIQNNLQQIGINVKLQSVEYATERQMLDKGQFDLALGVWSPDYADPYMFMNFWFDSKNFGLAGNRAFYSNPKVDQLIREAASITDQKKRTEIYTEAQKIVVDDAPYVYLYQKNYLLPMRSNVKGFVYNPMLEQMYNLADMSKS